MRTKVIVQLFSRGWKAWNSTHMFTHNFLFGSDFNEKPWCPTFCLDPGLYASMQQFKSNSPRLTFPFYFYFFLSLFATDNCTKINSFPMVLNSIQMHHRASTFSRKWNKTYGRKLRTLSKLFHCEISYIPQENIITRRGSFFSDYTNCSRKKKNLVFSFISCQCHWLLKSIHIWLFSVHCNFYTAPGGYFFGSLNKTFTSAHDCVAAVFAIINTATD